MERSEFPGRLPARPGIAPPETFWNSCALKNSTEMPSPSSAKVRKNAGVGLIQGRPVTVQRGAGRAVEHGIQGAGLVDDMFPSAGARPAAPNGMSAGSFPAERAGRPSGVNPARARASRGLRSRGIAPNPAWTGPPPASSPALAEASLATTRFQPPGSGQDIGRQNRGCRSAPSRARRSAAVRQHSQRGFS